MIKHIDLKYDKQKLIEEFDSTKKTLHRPSKEKSKSWFSEQESWRTATVEGQCEETERIRVELEKTFEVPVTAKFFKLEEGEGIPPHVDHGHRAAINIILSDDPAPIRYRGEEEVFYECAILNVAKRHEVLPGAERKMIKYQIGRLFFDDVIQLYNQKKISD
jgi:hypothetical protein